MANDVTSFATSGDIVGAVISTGDVVIGPSGGIAAGGKITNGTASGSQLPNKTTAGGATVF